MEALQRLHNRGSIATGYDIDNSLKFEADNTEYLTRTPSSDSNRKTFTTSLWVKRTELGLGVSEANQTLFGAQPASGFSNNNTFQWGFTHDDKFGLGLQTYWVIQTNRVFRDTSAWYHIVVRTDTTQPFSHNRIRLYVNGVQDTSFSINALSNVTEDYLFGINHTTRHQIGSLIANSWHSKCYIAEINHIDGQSHAPSYFGEFDDDTGIWKPKAYAGSYGTNGFYLDFSDAANLGDDASGNGNNFTENNITAADQATDTPTNNFCTFNAVNMYGNTAKLAEGATFTASTANGAFTTYGTMAPSAGKWWWEGKIQVFEVGSNVYPCIGATTNLAGLPSVSAQLSGGHVIKLATNQKWVLNSTGYTYGTAYTDGQYINIGLDLDNKKFYTYRNGTIDDANGIDISSTTFDGFGSQWMPLVITYGSGGASSYEINFGGYHTYSIGSPQSDANGYGTFEYAPPSGYYALCTKNLEEFG